MHLLPVPRASLDDGAEAIDLAQPPGDVVALSFADTDLSALAAAARKVPALTVRLASLRRLKHPLSVDLYAEKTVAHARFVLVRCLGGLDYWAYGLHTLAALCAERGIPFVALPGDDRDDPRLTALCSAKAVVRDEIDRLFRAGGPENARRVLDLVAREIGAVIAADRPSADAEAPAAFAWSSSGPLSLAEALGRCDPAAPLAHLLVYRSGVLADDTAAVEGLGAGLRANGLGVVTLAVTSLKDPAAVAVLEEAIAARRPNVIVTTTAFSARDGAGFVLDGADCPVLQATPVGVSREDWAASSRGLSAADIAMQLAMPEFDGRITAGPFAFKEEAPHDPALAFSRRVFAPDAEGVAHVAALARRWAALSLTPRAERTLALVLPDYPARGGRAGYAAGLDTPASVAGILNMLRGAGYEVGGTFDPETLLPALTDAASRQQDAQGAPVSRSYRTGSCQAGLDPVSPCRPDTGSAPPRGSFGERLSYGLADYVAWLATLPPARRAELHAAWGAPEADIAFCTREDAFAFPVIRAGAVTIALQPDRGRGIDRKAAFHDPDLTPTHGFLAFHRAMQAFDALIFLGAHGAAEWLPGKAVALSPGCWPRLALGASPVIYPFIVDDPGEAAPAKRRIGAVTLGHLTPAVIAGGLDDEAAALRALVEEFSAAQVLDPRRAALVADDILARARGAGLAAVCDVDETTPMAEALTRLDAHLCDIGETAMRDGLHVFGVARPGFEESARSENDHLLRALDGRFVPPGPSGSPSRGRTDVLPTGRNMATLDPRAIPSRAAADLGARAADEVVRRHLQDHGDWPRRIVMDLWASPTLRTGGEDIAHALALMGVRPTWDVGSHRVNGFEITPSPKLDRPRADVTARVSGAFRDTFPEQIALLDAAARAVAALDEDDDWNEPAAARRRGEAGARVFGAAPGRYGAGVSHAALDAGEASRAALGAVYLAAGSHAYGRAGEGAPDGSFQARIARADAFVHVTDVAERDLLDGDAVADSAGGFAAAAQSLGATPALWSLDASRPEQPKARAFGEDIDRVARGRLANPRWLEAQLRHGWRGVAEIAQGVDGLFAFAATTDAVTTAQWDRLWTALVDSDRLARIEAANPPGAAAIRDRFAVAFQRGYWRSRLNSVGAALEAAE